MILTDKNTDLQFGCNLYTRSTAYNCLYSSPISLKLINMNMRRVTTSLVLLLLIAGIFAMWRVVQVSASWGCLTGGDHAGADFDPATDCPSGLFAGAHTNIGTFHIDTGQTGSIQPYSAGSYGTASISATTVTIAGTLTGVGNGYTAGTGSGGGTTNGSGAHGGDGAGSGHGSSYDSYTAPVLPGGASQYAAGGGAIQLIASGTLTVNGTITMKGGSTSSCSGQSAGAGGSVYLTAGTFAGSGSINANGGDYGGGCGNSAAGGGGGRIAIYYSSSNTYSGTAPTVNAGAAGGSGTGQTGTCIIVDSTNNDLYITASQTWNAKPSTEGSAVISYHNITVSNNATWTFIGYNTTSSDGVGSYLKATNNFTINAGSTLTADYSGYGTSTGPGAPTGIGGGGYGGAGGTANNGNAGGASYGSYSAPVDLGSGGSNGSGGGAIHLQALGILTVSGTISANGIDGSQPACAVYSPGSGGSIYLQAGTFAGAATGIIRANGGNYPGGCGSVPGGGGGGRIAIHYTAANTYAGAIPRVNGGTGNISGENGTCFIIDQTNNDLYITTSQTWNANPSHEGGTLSFRNVTISNSSTVTIDGYFTNGTNGVGISLSTTNFTLGSGSSLFGSQHGYGGGTGGPGGGGGTGAGGGGAGYGGAGGAGASGAAGPTYGSQAAPIDLGSAGSSGNGGYGGAAIHISSTSSMELHGTISMDGGTSTGGCPGTGAGSGGSIYLQTSYLTGNPTLSAKGGNYVNGCGGAGSSGGGGRIAVYYTANPGYSGTATVSGGTGGTANGSAGTLVLQLQQVNSHPRSVQISNSSPSASGVSYLVTFTPLTSITNPDVVIDFCSNSPAIGGNCTATAGTDVPNFSSASAGSGWTLSTIGSNRGVKLTTSTVNFTAGTSATITISGVTNPSGIGSFYARILTYKTGTAGSNTSDSPGPWIDSGGAALSTAYTVSVTAVIEETLTFCVSGSPISSCGTTTAPSFALGHSIGGVTILDASAVDTRSIYTQTSTNAQQGVVVRLRNLSSSTCGGLSANGGTSCPIPAAGATAATLTAGTAALGLCVAAGSANTTASAPYNTASCTQYGLDDTSGTSVLTASGSPLFSSTGALNAENDTLTWAATAGTVTPAGNYTAVYSLVATGTY